MKLHIATVVVGLSMIAFAHPAAPGHIPGDRLIENLTKRIPKEQGNAELYYLIGRAHYATYSRALETSWSKEGEVEIYNYDEKLPHFYSLPGNIYPWDSKSVVADTTDNRRHVEGAIKNLRLAIEMTEGKTAARVPANAGLAHLTLACTLDSGSPLAGKVTLVEPYKAWKNSKQWLAEAAKEYLLAFQKSKVPEAHYTEKPIFGLQTMVTYEAGLSYLRLQPNAPDSKEVRAEVDRLKKLPPPHMITPLVLDLTESRKLDELLQPATKVNFDLDGSGRNQNYGWVKPTTAFLVWDPEHKGKITSGRQLFGNATWWMLWDNAYAALDALDDNHDGWLTSKELKGLALWYDRNGNGKSDPGEVIPIEQTQISALNTHSDGRDGLSFSSSEGLKLKDGRVLPTYDWVTKTTN